MSLLEADIRSEDESFVTEALTSPFAGAASFLEAPTAEQWFESGSGTQLSPFAEGFAFADEQQLDEAAVEALLNELEDEEFDEAVQGLVDEVAGRHLSATSLWSSEGEAFSLGSAEVEAWMGQLEAEVDRLLSQMEQHFGDRMPESLTEDELETVGQQLLAQHPGLDAASEQFLGGLVKKAGKLVKGVAKVAKKGLSAIAKILPMGKLFGILGKLVKPLLTRVLNKAINRLPAALRPVATSLAQRLGREDEAMESESFQFDALLAEAVMADSEAMADQLVGEAESAAVQGVDRAGELDMARARLVNQLHEMIPGEAPTVQVEQFIPVVMAALPLIRTGIGIVGRQRVVNFLAARLADLIKGYVGEQAARSLSRPIVDAGLRMLTLESESMSVLGTESLVSAVEDTIREVASLPAESFEVSGRLEAEIQEAFSEAAARHLPRDLLRSDLEGFETEDEGGMWVLMPRATRPSFRYRKYSRVYPTAISRPIARAVLLSDGDTLERRLLEAGVNSWPVQSEVHLFEAIPGTQLGHLAAFEDEATSGEFEELTPQSATALIRQPGLGRPPANRPGRPPRPGQRFYRVVVPGKRLRRRRPSLAVRVDITGAKPVIRVHVMWSEREALQTVERLSKGGPTQVVASIRAMFNSARKQNLARVLGLRISKAVGSAPTPSRAETLSSQIAEAIVTTLAKELPQAATALTAATRDPARGITLTFSFGFAAKEALNTATPEGPTLKIRPGWHRD